MLSDPLLEGLTAGDSGLIDEAVPALGAALVVATGHIWATLRRRDADGFRQCQPRLSVGTTAFTRTITRSAGDRLLTAAGH